MYGYLWFTDTYEKMAAQLHSQIQKLENDLQEAKSNEYQLQVIYSNKPFDFYEAWSIRKMRVYY